MGVLRVLVGCLAGLFGAFVGAAVAIALSYALVSGAEADALTWLALGVFFCFFGIPMGAAGALLLWLQLWPKRS